MTCAECGSRPGTHFGRCSSAPAAARESVRSWEIAVELRDAVTGLLRAAGLAVPDGAVKMAAEGDRVTMEIRADLAAALAAGVAWGRGR